MNIPEFLPYLNIVLALALTIGGFFAFRQGYSKEAGRIQEKVIAAQKEQVETLERQIVGIDKETKRLNRVIATIRYALKRRGLHIIVNGDFITVVDEATKSQVRQEEQIAIHDEDVSHSS
jgi:hypothetical protein